LKLLKGKDDLRQDAVMQQLFTVVNRLLDKDDLTCHRSLNIRTYKVVPLTILDFFFHNFRILNETLEAY
ncbi:unnamed protein product, partial [Rotaria sordida]